HRRSFPPRTCRGGTGTPAPGPNDRRVPGFQAAEFPSSYRTEAAAHATVSLPPQRVSIARVGARLPLPGNRISRKFFLPVERVAPSLYAGDPLGDPTTPALYSGVGGGADSFFQRAHLFLHSRCPSPDRRVSGRGGAGSSVGIF